METVKRIYHIGDVHCRLLQRHKEYREVFDRMFHTIKETGTDESLIVLVGDIVHSKTDMTPELVSLVSYFLKGCADLCPTILIPGNHDFNLSNQNRMDALSPIVDALDHDNLIYFKDTGTLIQGDVKFHHYSVLGDQENWNGLAPILNDNYTHVALYHGAVSGATTDIGFSEFTDALPRNMFESYDMTMLGDIHKTQFLDTNERIGYCGSLIQQDQGELPERGFLVWDVPSRKATRMLVENDYAYVTIKIKDGEILNMPKPPKHARVRVIHEGTDKATLKGLLDKVKNEYSVSELRVSGTKVEKADQSIQVEDVINSRQVEVQMKLYKEFLVNEDIEESVWSSIEAINNDLNSKIRNIEISGRGINWRPLEFEFSNMFSYGEDNFIDFDTLEGIAGLFAPNASGKSTLLDAIVFCIFDKCSRTSKAVHVMNNQADEFHCRFRFSIGESIFEIIRDGKRNTNGSVSVKVEFYKDGECLNGKRRDETNKNIRDYIGTYDDFVLTTMSTQNDNRSFIDMTKKDRQELLYRFLDIYVFIELFKLAKEESKSLAANIKMMGAIDYDARISEATDAIELATTGLEDWEGNMEVLQLQNTELTEAVEAKLQSKLPIDSSLDLESLEIQKTQVDRRLRLATDENIQAIQRSESAKIEYDNQGKLVDAIDIEPTRDMLSKLENAKRMVGQDKQRLRLLESERGHLNSQVDALLAHEYDPKCVYCTNNQFVIDAKESEIKLIDVNFNIVELEAKVIAEVEIDTRLDECYVAIKKYDELNRMYKSLEVQLKDIDGDIKRTEMQIGHEKSQFEVIVDKITRCEKQADSIESNKIIEVEVDKLRSERTMLMHKIREANQYITDHKTMLARQSTLLTEAQERKNDYIEAVGKYSAYEYLMKAVNRDGVPYMILKRILPVIETEVNEVLNGIVDFTFQIEVSDSDTIDGTIHYGEDQWAIELISGMERFILSIAIRSSLIRLSGLPKPNFLAIDEGFGVLDSDKLNSIYILFEYLKTHFDFVLCISHISEMKDYTDQLIHINKVNGKSKITLR